MVDLYKGAPKMTVAFPYLIPDSSVPSSIPVVCAAEPADLKQGVQFIDCELKFR